MDFFGCAFLEKDTTKKPSKTDRQIKSIPAHWFVKKKKIKVSRFLS